MFIGLPNPNVVMKLEKMRITNMDKGGSPIIVLYNPQTYIQQKSVNYKPVPMLGSDVPIIQFINGSNETLSFELFFDSVSSGTEVGGNMGDRLLFGANSVIPTVKDLIDIRDYTGKIYDLMHIDGDLHRPPKLKVEWSSLQFEGFLAECTQRFTKFDEKGKPVRAVLQCTFIEHRDIKKMSKGNPLNSPDTTKYHMVRQGDSCWALAAEEYGDPGMWREIAAANGITNPRKLQPGSLLTIPALL